uniref:Uncharacterized protein n=1 Tax=Anguilla anguilla TaxID=7936 RepID=A0A0E9UMV1_ANGAN
MCSVRAAPALKLNSILFIATAACCAFGMCVMNLCFRRRQGRNTAVAKRPQQPRAASQPQARSAKNTNEAEATEFRVYENVKL